ncbi:LppU/SCO3897 family protein [Mycobacteroides abscessus]
MLSALRAGQIPNEFPVVTESLGVGLEQGDCVNLDQVLGRTQLNKVQCGDSSAFRVIQIVSTVEQCVNDADLTYYSATKRYAACLDYDWSPDRCLLIEQGQPVRKVDCATPRSERVELIVMSTDNTLNCSQGGFAHPTRRFTVCTEAQK